MEVCGRIKHLRKKILKLTQDEFAERLHISRSNMGNIEIGRISITDRVINDICMAYNVNEQWLRTGEGEIFNEGNPLIVESLLETFQELIPEYKEYLLQQAENLLVIQKRQEAKLQGISDDTAKAADAPGQEDQTGDK